MTRKIINGRTALSVTLTVLLWASLWAVYNKAYDRVLPAITSDPNKQVLVQAGIAAALLLTAPTWE